MKTLEERVQILEANFASLQEAFLTSQTNNAESQGKIDNTSNAVEQITPTTYTKTAYIGDTEVVFTDVPRGIINVYAEDTEGEHPTGLLVNTEGDRVIVTSRYPIEKVTTITLSIV